MEHYVRLPLQNAYNVRELGGYPTSDGRVVRWQRLLRADDISALSEQDCRFLQDYGLRSILDLRSLEEVQAAPDVVPDGVVYQNIPFMAGDIQDATRVLSQQAFDLGDFYVELLKQKEKVKALMEFIAQAPTGVLLFHCSAGKDRTGVLSMLLHQLAKVKTSDMLAHYQMTYVCLKEKPGFDTMVPADMDRSCLYSLPEMIAKPIAYLAENYQGIEDYLAQCSVAEATIMQIKKRLLEE